MGAAIRGHRGRLGGGTGLVHVAAVLSTRLTRHLLLFESARYDVSEEQPGEEGDRLGGGGDGTGTRTGDGMDVIITNRRDAGRALPTRAYG